MEGIKVLSKKQTIAARSIMAVFAVVLSVGLPQLFHFVGSISGLDTSLASSFLPMHLGVLLIGLLAGPLYGFAAGALSPLISFGLSGMPTAAMLPFMMIELGVYGIVCGFLKRKKMPVVIKVLIAQIAGRLVKTAAIAIGFFGFNSVITMQSALSGMLAGLPGIILQLVLIPLLIYRIKSSPKLKFLGE